MHNKLWPLVFAIALWAGGACAQQLSSPLRATANVTVFVDGALGTDTPTNGLTSGSGAFKTPGYGVRWICDNLDAAGYKVVMNIENDVPVYNTNPVSGAIGGIELCNVERALNNWVTHPLVIQGTQGGVAVASPCNGPLLSFQTMGAVVGVGVSTVWELAGLQLQSTIADVEADRGSKINVNNLSFGGCVNSFPSPQKMTAIYGGSIEMLTNVQVASGGNQVVFSGNQGLFIQVGGTYIVFVNKPNFVNGSKVVDSTSQAVGFQTTGQWTGPPNQQ